MSVTDFLADLGQTLPEGAVITDMARRTAQSRDVFISSGRVVAAVVRPTDLKDVQTLVACAKRHGIQLRIRGAGLSYSGGYVPQSDTDVMVDMSGLSAIVAIDRANMVATVEAGCSWQTLREALMPHGLEVDMNAPVSGSHATVGGGISQGLPGDMSGVLSVGVVLADGETIVTGSAGTTPSGVAFNRYHGPDLTGLFIGDCGIYGIKTHVALRLRPVRPVAHACFVFADLPALVRAAARIGPTGLARRCMGLDPGKTKQAHPPTLKETARAALDIVRLGGPIEAARVGLGALRPGSLEGWTLHITTSGPSDRAARDAMAHVRKICAQAIGEMSPVVARALHAQPFSIRGSAGRTGEAWVPVHGILPPSKAVEAAQAVDAFLRERAAELSARGIETGVLISAGPAYVLIEPMLLWPDTLAPVVAQALGADRMKRFDHEPACEDLRAYVSQTRAQLRDLLKRFDATFLQVGTYYRLDARSPLAGTLDKLKSALDEDRTLSSGNCVF